MSWIKHILSIEDATVGEVVGGATEVAGDAATQTIDPVQAGAEQVAEGEPVVEPEITEASEPAVVLSSYQRLKARSEETASTYMAKIAELEGKLAENEGFVGIKIDKPSDEWGVEGAKQALAGLPEAHRDLVTTAVIDDYLPTIAQMVAANPAEYEADYNALNKALVPIAEFAYERPLNEINSILAMTQGITAQQLHGLLSGQGANLPAGGQASVFQGGGLGANPFIAEAQRSGMDVEDESTQKFLGAVGGAFSQLQRQAATVENENKALSARLTKLEQGHSSQSEASVAREIDQQIDAGRSGAFELATKDATGNSRIPAGDTRSARLIKLTAEDELKTSTLATHRANALKWQKDGLKDQAGRALNLARGVINAAYAKAAADVLGAPAATVPNKQQPTRLVGGGQPAATGNVKEMLDKMGPIGSDWDKARKQAEALFQATSGT